MTRWRRAALVEASLAAIRKKGTALAARSHRLVRHRGHTKAVRAVTHALLRAAYHVLRRGGPYRNLAARYFGVRHRKRVTRRAVHALEQQGYRVTPGSAA